MRRRSLADFQVKIIISGELGKEIESLNFCTDIAKPRINSCCEWSFSLTVFKGHNNGKGCLFYYHSRELH